MFNPEDKDFATIESWGLKEDPLKAIKDYSDLKLELRWLNPYQRDAHVVYYNKRVDYIKQKNFDNYYKTAEKPIDRRRWEYLKDRKAWYICPLEWDRFAAKDVKRIMDLGCGDGDVTQRVLDYIAQCWEKEGYAGHDLEVYGYDLNESRIKNAQLHVKSPHPKITIKFDACDAIGKGVPHEDNFFDYTVNTGVFEILEDEPADAFMKEMCRVTKLGIYVEDLIDEYPGGYPRDDFEGLFNAHGFTLLHDHSVFTEPFSLDGSQDPMELWPVSHDRIMFAIPKK